MRVSVRQFWQGRMQCMQAALVLVQGLCKEFFKRADACGNRRGTSSREKVLSDCQYIVKRTGDGGAFCISGTFITGV